MHRIKNCSHHLETWSSSLNDDGSLEVHFVPSTVGRDHLQNVSPSTQLSQTHWTRTCTIQIPKSNSLESTENEGLQWNLRTRDTLEATTLSLVERLSLSQK